MMGGRAFLLQTVPPYDLIRTLTCGQVFRWKVQDHLARGVCAGKPIALQQWGNHVEAFGLHSPGEQARLVRYLGLDQPLAQVERTLGTDRILRRILPSTTGIALTRQDPWECLVSFVVSAFNNIPKIEMTLDRLCRRYGDPLNGIAWSFPGPDRLARAGLRDLEGCLLGYRGPYVREIARRVYAGEFDLQAPMSMPYREARGKLLDLPGVGEKVVDCVLLFAYGKGEAFPVDVWVKRAVERLYFSGRPVSGRQIRAFARERFGALAGYAQQHLFYHIREQGTGNGARHAVKALRRSGHLHRL